MLLLTLLFTSALAFDYLSPDLVAFFNKPRDTVADKLHLHIVEEALYETERLEFNASTKDINKLRMTPGTKLYNYIIGKDWNLYAVRRLLTAFIEGALTNKSAFDPNRAYETVHFAEVVKKPLETRVGMLLKQQHKHWLANPSAVAVLNGVPILAEQVFLIFGIFDVNNNEQCRAIIDFIRRHKLFKNHIIYRKKLGSNGFHIFPKIDHMMSIILHDPNLGTLVSNSRSTLPNFNWTDYKLSKMDKLVQNFLKKVFDIDYDPGMLFSGNVNIPAQAQ